MKTVKYTIQFDYLEQMGSSEIVISKAEYDKQLKRLRSQKERSDVEGFEFPIETREYVDDYKTHIMTTYVFQSGCAEIWLNKYECKKGYKFSTKK